MFPIKLSPVKASIDSVLDTAKSSLQTPNKPATNSTNLTPSTPSTAAPTSPPTPTVVPPTPTSTAPPSPAADPAPSLPTIATAVSTIAQLAPTPTRPTATQRPSWIGPRPDRPVTPGAQAMKQFVTVEYASSGLQPPVYVFTSLSDPAWDAVEMDHEKKDNGDFRFHKSFSAEEGEYQYKFRLGPGEWWALDDGKPMVDDGMGNKNNLMVVKQAELAPAPAPAASAPLPAPVEQVKAGEKPTTAPPATSADSAPKVDRPKSIRLPTAVALPDNVPTPPAAPLMKHETFAPPADQPKLSRVEPPQSIRMPAALPPNPAATTGNTAVTPGPAPLMKHETFVHDTKPGGADKGEVDDDAGQWRPTVEDDEDADQYDEDDEIELDEHEGPLMRHESLNPDAVENERSPLMRHESNAIGNHIEPEHFAMSKAQFTPLFKTSSAEGSMAPEADLNDPTLERFPTDQQSIYEHIHRSSMQMLEDETPEDVNSNKSVSPQLSAAGKSVGSLPSVQEDEDEEADPNAAPMLLVTEPMATRPFSPITPPMTPQEAEKIVEEIVEEAEAEQIVNEIVGRKPAKHNEQIVVEFVQERGGFGTVADVLMHPMSLLAIVGVAMAVAAGIWKLRYA